VAWANRSKHFNLTSWWGMLLLSVIAGLLVGGLVALFWPSTYNATSSFFVSDPAELLSTMLKSTTGLPGNADQNNLKPTSERLAAILSSRLMRSKLVAKQQLDQRLGLRPIEAEETLARMATITPIGTEGFSITVTCKGYTSLRKAVSHALVQEEARQLCAGLANDYLAELQQYVTETSVSEARKRREFIESAQRQVLVQLTRAQVGMERLQRAHALLDPDSQAALVTDRIRALELAEAEVRAKVAETQSSLAKAQGQLGRVDSMRVASIVEMRNPIISQVEQKIADLRVELATQEAQGKTRQNRDVVQIVTALEACELQLNQLKQDVHKEIAQSANPTYEKIVGQVVDLQVTLAGARARSSRTAAILGAARGELAQLPPVARQFAELKQDQEVQFQAMAALKQSLAVALVQEQQSQRVGEFLVLDEAVPPPDLYNPPVLWSMLLTILLFLAVMGLVGLNRMIFGR
jgi:uncharacterized protein involved in exopolysaccharide biosynthesis